MTWDGSLSISALHAAYASGATTPTEVARAVHHRLTAYASEVDPAVWIAVVPLDSLLERAAELERAYAGKDKPALFGVPMSVKNSIDVAGFKTTLACPDFAYVADKTAPAVQRALDAGAILVGTTNLDQFATVRALPLPRFRSLPLSQSLMIMLCRDSSATAARTARRARCSTRTTSPAAARPGRPSRSAPSSSLCASSALSLLSRRPAGAVEPRAGSC